MYRECVPMNEGKPTLEELRQEAKALIMELTEDECGYILDELRRYKENGSA